MISFQAFSWNCQSLFYSFYNITQEFRMEFQPCRNLLPESIRVFCQYTFPRECKGLKGNHQDTQLRCQCYELFFDKVRMLTLHTRQLPARAVLHSPTSLSMIKNVSQYYNSENLPQISSFSSQNFNWQHRFMTYLLNLFIFVFVDVSELGIRFQQLQSNNSMSSQKGNFGDLRKSNRPDSDEKFESFEEEQSSSYSSIGNSIASLEINAVTINSFDVAIQTEFAITNAQSYMQMCEKCTYFQFQAQNAEEEKKALEHEIERLTKKMKQLERAVDNNKAQTSKSLAELEHNYCVSSLKEIIQSYESEQKQIIRFLEKTLGISNKIKPKTMRQLVETVVLDFLADWRETFRELEKLADGLAKDPRQNGMRSQHSAKYNHYIILRKIELIGELAGGKQ